MPIYIITGFLDSGKTTSIIELIQGMQISDYRKTLLIVCEQGEVAYDDDTFAVFYIDATENPDRYVDKHVRFSGIVISEKKDACIVGRIALTCCSEDLSVFGLICDLIGDIKLNKDDWVDVDCREKGDHRYLKITATSPKSR